jgi:glucosamine-6-phosphate deaminase
VLREWAAHLKALVGARPAELGSCAVEIRIFDSKAELGRAAAARAAAVLREAIAGRGEARAIAATGASQFEFLDALIREGDLDWSKVELFHLDEYVGLPESHPASFRRYLKERLVERVHPGMFHSIDGQTSDPAAECRRVGALIARAPVDVAFVGIGENGHLAFNDPPADFETEDPYLVVTLDEPCRRQQLGEGWFSSLAEVPPRAISMSVRQILKAGEIVAAVPDARKAAAVRDCLEGLVSTMHPASILQRHPRTTVYLDRGSASLLSPAGQDAGRRAGAGGSRAPSGEGG